MKKIGVIILLAFIVSCNKKAEEQKVSAIDSAVIKAPDTAYVSMNIEFLNKFKETTADTLLFQSPENSIQPIRNAPQINDEEIHLFPTLFKKGNLRKPDVYAISKFSLDKDNIGLVVQSPGDYSLSALNLLVYNKQADGITATIELADRTTDKGYSDEKKTWLMKDSLGIKGLMHLYTSIEPVDANDPTRPSKTNDYWWIRFKNGKIDTTRVSSSEMPLANKIMKFNKVQ